MSYNKSVLKIQNFLEVIVQIIGVNRMVQTLYKASHINNFEILHKKNLYLIKI